MRLKKSLLENGVTQVYIPTRRPRGRHMVAWVWPSTKDGFAQSRPQGGFHASPWLHGIDH